MEAEWMARGRCRDMSPNVFFPSDGVGVQLAQAICARCEVRADCLEYALTHRVEHGVWGGASERERKRLLRQRRLSLRPVAAGRPLALMDRPDQEALRRLEPEVSSRSAASSSSRVIFDRPATPATPARS